MWLWLWLWLRGGDSVDVTLWLACVWLCVFVVVTMWLRGERVCGSWYITQAYGSGAG